VKRVAETSADYDVRSERLSRRELLTLIHEFEEEMRRAAAELEYERAAVLRDQIRDLRATLDLMDERPEWERMRQPLAERSPTRFDRPQSAP